MFSYNKLCINANFNLLIFLKQDLFVKQIHSKNHLKCKVYFFNEHIKNTDYFVIDFFSHYYSC